MQRDRSIDFLKGLCIVLVVYAHLPMDGAMHDMLHSLSGFIYTFHIQLFVMITGYLFAHNIDSGFRGMTKVVNRMWKPYFVVAPLNLLLYVLAGIIGLKTTNTVTGVCDGAIQILLGNGGGALWYLYTYGVLELLLLFFGAVLFNFADKHVKILAQCILACLVFHFCDVLGLDLFTSWVPFFFVGIAFGRSFKRFPRHGASLFFAPLAYFLFKEMGEECFIMHIIWVALLAFGILGVADRVNDYVLGRMFSFLGKHSLTILLFHPMFTTVARLFSNYVLEIEGTGILLSVIVLIFDIGCCIISELIMRMLRVNKLVF
jgi:fucose 4-O-acetylase-like acetyltransferase